jgi:hypothetical protein
MEQQLAIDSFFVRKDSRLHALIDASSTRCSVYSLYWYKSTSADAAAQHALIDANTPRTRFTCFTGTKVQVLTQLRNISVYPRKWEEIWHHELANRLIEPK